MPMYKKVTDTQTLRVKWSHWK